MSTSDPTSEIHDDPESVHFELAHQPDPLEATYTQEYYAKSREMFLGAVAPAVRDINEKLGTEYTPAEGLQALAMADNDKFNTETRQAASAKEEAQSMIDRVKKIP